MSEEKKTTVIEAPVNVEALTMPAKHLPGAVREELAELEGVQVTDKRHHAIPTEGPIPAGSALQLRNGVAMAATTPTPGDLLAIAVNQGADIDKLEKLMDLQLRWEANEARKAYAAAMAAFKKDPPQILKDQAVGYENSKGQWVGYKHASLGNVAMAIAAALGEHGLTASWIPKQGDKGAITVTCTITHEAGHSESASLTAAPDNSGKKNPIQALGSTVSYLERYTILALTGLATRDQDDDDGAASDPATRPPQDDDPPDPSDQRRSTREPAPNKHQERVSTALQRLSAYGVTKADLIGKFGPTDTWNDEAFKKMTAWKSAFKGCGGDRKKEEKLLRSLFELEPGATEEL